MTIRMQPQPSLDRIGGLTSKKSIELSVDEALQALHGPTPDVLKGDRLELSGAGDAMSNVLTISEKVREPQTKETTPEASLAPTPPVPKKAPAVLAQEEALAKALAGEAAAFSTMRGETLEVRVSPAKKAAKGAAEYRLSIDASHVQVTVTPGLEPKEQMAKLVEFMSKVPMHLRPALKHIKLETIQNPEDDYWAKVYGQPSFASAASAGGGVITVWNLAENPYNLNEGVFNHEMAHLIGAAYSTSRTRHAEMIPPGWEEAVKADGNRVSEYGAHNANEDFSEAWRYYLEARRTPEALAAFQEKYPNRTRILEAIYQHEFKGKFTIAMFLPDRVAVPGREGASLA